VRNPVGIKVSANADTDDLLRIIDKVDPQNVSPAA
jgi:3-deoxy-D-arabino-heptulosonate 7-phosphate (DAHP) synthase class II